MKANGEKTTEGNSGVGSPSHIAGIQLQQTLGLKWQMIPYRSAGLSMQDLVAGNIDIALDAPPVALPQLQAGAIKTYAVAAQKRIAIMPDIPTTDEAGLPGFYFSFWHAIWAPKGTPKDIVAKLNAAVVAALADPATLKRLIDFGAGNLSARPADARSAGGVPQGRNREMVADHQGCRRQGGIGRSSAHPRESEDPFTLRDGFSLSQE